jgi:hypothetical protein
MINGGAAANALPAEPSNACVAGYAALAATRKPFSNPLLNLNCP